MLVLPVSTIGEKVGNMNNERELRLFCDECVELCCSLANRANNITSVHWSLEKISPVKSTEHG